MYIYNNLHLYITCTLTVINYIIVYKLVFICCEGNSSDGSENSNTESSKDCKTSHRRTNFHSTTSTYSLTTTFNSYNIPSLHSLGHWGWSCHIKERIGYNWYHGYSQWTQARCNKPCSLQQYKHWGYVERFTKDEPYLCLRHVCESYSVCGRWANVSNIFTQQQ